MFLTVFIDLSKVVDAISYKILYTKMHTNWIRRLPLQLVIDYMKNRQQIMKFGKI